MANKTKYPLKKVAASLVYWLLLAAEKGSCNHVLVMFLYILRLDISQVEPV